MMDNTIVLAGNLTRDVDLKFTTGGTCIAEAALAVNKRFQRNGEWQQEVHYFDLVAFGELAEHFNGSCKKGDRVLVSGQLRQERWETESGDKRSRVKISLDDVGPSLKWATCEVTRIERSDRSVAGQTQQTAQQAASSFSYDSGEEPF